MSQLKDLKAEQEYTAKVQKLLLQVIEQSVSISDTHSESIRMMIADAWDELRMKPTALSPQDLEQLSAEIDRFMIRKTFTDSMAERYHKMLMEPFFARVDFIEEGESELEKIVIGLYSLKDEKGNLIVHDWRAPVSSLYYDAIPGDASYDSPSGIIRGEMTLKRQYRMENGKLIYYVDTNVSIDDEMLLDILSGTKSRHMRQIVSTIQTEQNAAIRHESAKVVSVVGGAGSGKTSVAMHRAAYLMYRQRDVLEARRIQILSPGSAFSEYISTILPELGEENIRARTMHEIVEEILGRKVETPFKQLERLLDNGGELRRRSVAYKCGVEFMRRLRNYAESFAVLGPDFGNVKLDGQTLIRRDELRLMYKNEFSLLTPAQRLTRIKATLDTRFSSWEESLYRQYEEQFSGSYSGRELKFVCRMAVSQRLQPVRQQLKGLLEMTGSELYLNAIKDAPDELKKAYEENRQAGLIWWEDAVGQAYLMVKLGFAQPDKSIYHMIVDEAQDYSETGLALLSMYYPNAKVTLLGDPMQRTCPAMSECNPDNWGECFGESDAKVFRLNMCYRATLPIARMCNALLPENNRITPFGREGKMPSVEEYSDEKVDEAIKRFREDGNKSLAVITRTQSQAERLSRILKDVYLFDGSPEDDRYAADDTVLGSYHLMKGLEFDAVIVVWPDVELTDDERRRLYTACSRALHGLTLLGGPGLLKDLGIVV